MMYARYFAFSILWLAAMLVGPFAYWLLPRDMVVRLPQGYGRYRWKWADAIWGNNIDGLTGDKAYRNGLYGRGWWNKYWPSFWWSCVRNPANNLARGLLGCHGIITRIERKGNWTFATVSGKRYFLYYNKGGRYLVKFGWKIWDNYGVGDLLDAAFVLNP